MFDEVLWCGKVFYDTQGLDHFGVNNIVNTVLNVSTKNNIHVIMRLPFQTWLVQQLKMLWLRHILNQAYYQNPAAEALEQCQKQPPTK